ncbi:hypothetical protein ITJ54_10590 [Curtobacterium sp. VKM Ac-2865]|uniref:hypothetical protein n=1 Tax=Curtobacterium sp. VKM Ac-2865 TaxID=2783817 RepID=UPI00188C6526|nr:hypothetical protein [Curtobacterium sp. VKM Ac-2865]MBF4583116.1 hypothetical protein [Curtobacterium sp. VKM Ac-2865]
MTPAPDATTDVVEWDLSLDELRAVHDHLPGLVLPSFVPEGTSTADAGLVDVLVAKGVLTAMPTPAAESWSEDLDAPFLMTLALQNAGAIVIQVSAWTPTSTTAHSTVIQATAASHLTVWTGADHGDARARVRGTVLDLAWQTLASLVPELQVVDRVRGTTTVSTVASQAIVDAIAGRDARVLDAVVKELHVPADAVPLFRGLAEPVRHGFRVKAFTLDSGPVFAGNWFGTSTGWLRMSVGLDAAARTGEVTPETITDAGTVTVTAQTDEDIRTELLSLVAGLIKDRDVIGGSDV